MLMVATVLTVYGIETSRYQDFDLEYAAVATVLTVYGIETIEIDNIILFSFNQLQQCLPFTVLKLFTI